jgi:hypothetical protein
VLPARKEGITKRSFQKGRKAFFYTNVKHERIQRAEGFWLAARSRRGKRSSATLTEQPTMLQDKRPGTTMRSCLELVLEQITQSLRKKQRRIFVSGKERERRCSSATSSEQRHSQKQKNKSVTAP